MLFPRFRQILRNRACHEEDHDYGRGDPEGSVEVWIAFHDVEEVCAGVEGCAAAVQGGGGVDVEELLVEGDGPEVAFGGGWGAAAAGVEGRGIGLDFGGGGGVGVEGYRYVC